MKLEELKKVRTILASLTMSYTLLLTGCGTSTNTIVLDGTDIVYEEGNISGTIPYEKIEEQIKIITLKTKDDTIILPIIKQCQYYPQTIFKYYDLESGTKIIEYYYKKKKEDENQEPDEIRIGECLEIKEEQYFSTYLLQAGNIKKEYDITELITFFHEKIEPQQEKQKEEQKVKK